MLADGYGGQVGKNARILKEEIAALEDKKKALNEIAEAEKASEIEKKPAAFVPVKLPELPPANLPIKPIINDESKNK